MKSTPLLSVGLPVYNGEDYLAQTIESILSQSYPDFELIISDNASTDTTAEICAHYVEKDSRVRYTRFGQNQGAARNYNHVVALARGKYFKWAAHDDLVGQDFFKLSVDRLEQYPEAVLAYPKTTIIDQKGHFVREYDDNLDLRKEDPLERFETYLNLYRKPHSCNPVFGVMRLETLLETPMIGNFVSSDMLLLGEMALRGQIHEISKARFFRRDHPKASVRAYPLYKDRIAWFDPQKRGHLQMTKWKWFEEYLSIMRRVPLEPDQRRRGYLLLARWTFWNFPGLSKDLVKAGLWPLLRIQAEGK